MNEKMIEIDGVQYPCYMTIGAMMAFKRMTGKEVDEMGGIGIEGIATLFFCCVRSACTREKREIPFNSVEELADYIRPEDLTAWNEHLIGDEQARKPGKKKQ